MKPVSETDPASSPSDASRPRSVMQLVSDLEMRNRAYEREKAARKDAEQLLESKSRELYNTNQRLTQLAAELKEQVEHTQAIVDSAAEGIVVFNHSGQILTFNPAAQAIFGDDSKQSVGRHICHYLPGATFCDSDGCILPERLGSGPESAVNADLIGVHRDGHRIPLDIVVNAIQHGDHRNYTVLLRDLTKRRQLELQLSQAQKMEAVGQLAAGIAHEINTPIQYVGDNIRFLNTSFQDLRRFMDLAHEFIAQSSEADSSFDSGSGFDSGSSEREGSSSRGDASSRAEDLRLLMESVDLDFLQSEIPLAIEQSMEGIETVAKIVRAMKEFSHPGASVKQAIDINRALESVLMVSRNEWKYCCYVDTEFASDLPPVPCLPNELNQAVLNLIVNAAHAIQSKLAGEERSSGRIGLKTFRDGESVVIEVSDTGCGIPLNVRDRVFDPFFTTKPIGKGTGQGLAIVYNVVVNKHDGQISFDSIEGEGTTFRIRLPIVLKSTLEIVPEFSTVGETL